MATESLAGGKMQANGGYTQRIDRVINGRGVVFRVESYEGSLSEMKGKGLVPDSTESDPSEGQFAHFHDPDGNEVTIWGK